METDAPDVTETEDATCDRPPEASDSLRTFGAVLRALRQHSGYTRKQLAEVVRFSVYTVASVERGTRLADDSLVERAEGVLGNTGALRESAKFVTRGSKGIAAWFRQWARLERTAVSLSTYECRTVPGLLQSEGYARAVFDNSIPPLSDEQMEAQVAARMKRQKLTRERPNTSFSFVLDEHIVRRRIGGDEVTRGQLDLIMELAQLRNVSVQIMPTDCACHGGLDGALALMETPNAKCLAYSEGQQTGRLINDPKETSILISRYVTLRSQALSPIDSMDLLRRIRGEL